MTELEKYIGSYFGVTNEDVGKVSALFKETELRKGEYFVKAGQYCERLSFVQDGYLRVFAEAGDKEITQWIGAKGFFVTDLSSLTFKQRARWNIQALTDCQLYTIQQAAYRTLPDVVPGWPELEKNFIASCFLTLEDRVFSHLSLSAEQRYDQFFEHNKEMFNEVPLQYLASMLGMSPETFSRIRNKKSAEK